jgi:hypothetical protein
MLTDERLNALIRGAELDLHDAERNQEHQERIEWYRDVLAALRHYQSLRRRDAAIEKAMREVEDDSEVVECIKVEFVNEKFHATIEEWDYGCMKRVEADTFSAALSALAAGGAV